MVGSPVKLEFDYAVNRWYRLAGVNSLCDHRNAEMGRLRCVIFPVFRKEKVDDSFLEINITFFIFSLIKNIVGFNNKYKQ